MLDNALGMPRRPWNAETAPALAPRHLAIGLLVCLAGYLAFGLVAGRLSDLGQQLTAPPDSRDYLQVSDWLLHGGAPPGAVAKRPLLYPVLLMVRAVGGLTSVWLAQLGCWLATIGFTAAAVWRLTRRHVLVVVVGAAFLLDPSLADLTYRMLAETLFMVCLAAFGWTLAMVAIEGASPSRIGAAVLLLAAATAVKPVAQLALLAVLLSLPLIPAVRQVVARRPGPVALAVMVGLLPVLIQLGVIWTHCGRVGVSTAGGEELRRYLVPALYLRVTEPLSWGDRRQALEHARATTDAWSDRRVMRFILTHPEKAAMVYRDQLVNENLQAGSMFFQGEHWWYLWSRAHGVLVSWLHLYMVPLTLLAVLAPGVDTRRRGLAIAGTLVVALLVIAPTGLVIWGGDRLVAVAKPLWLIAYLGTTGCLMDSPSVRALLRR